MLKKDFFIASQYVLPHHLLSRLVGGLADSELPWLKNRLIEQFVRHYDVNLDEAVHQHPQDFRSFNDFFTRELLPDARPLDDRPDSLLSPCDGAVSQLGNIQRGKIFQAKGQEFSLNQLLGGDRQRSEPFVGGKFATLYLSPRDYHRVHMPLAGKLKEMVYVPGSLFSVNQTTAERVPGLFARNERLVCIFETEYGPMAMVLVGAMIVAAIETVWAGRITPQQRTIKVVDYQNPQPVELDRGAEMGRFCLGSTVVLCFPDGMVNWSSDLHAGRAITMGSRIGSIQALATTRPISETDSTSEAAMAEPDASASADAASYNKLENAPEAAPGDSANETQSNTAENDTTGNETAENDTAEKDTAEKNTTQESDRKSAD